MRTLLILSVLLSACEPPEEGEGSSPVQPDDLVLKLRDAELADDRPEVGQISGCTATLVAQDVAITASHCVGYRTQTSLGRYNTLTLTNAGETRRFTVNRYRSFSRQLGDDDIALLGLDEMVPLDFATPAPIAAETPEDGTSLTVYGFGCTRLGSRGDGRKRRATYAQGDRAAHLCPGDSGGPVFNDETGAIQRINSGYRYDDIKSDIYGLVPGLHEDLLAQIQDWTNGEVPQEGEPLDPSIEVCGRNVDAFERWTCTPNHTHRHRCLPGGSPTWEICPLGCISSQRGKNDTCRSEEARDSCGDYRAYAAWTCALDDATLVRCGNGIIETQGCAGGCELTEGGEDACVQ